MTLFRKTVLTITTMIMVGAALTALPRPAHGCSCGIDYTLSDHIDDADVIFAGRPVQRIGSDDPSYHSALSRSYGVTVIFEVDQVFKGQAGPLLAARTASGEESCGYPRNRRDRNDPRAVLATLRGEHGWWVAEPGDLQVGYCGSWHTVKEITEALGPGYPPDETMVQVRELLENPDKAPAGLYWLIGTIVTALVGGAALAYRLRAGNPARRSSTGADHQTTGEQ